MNKGTRKTLHFANQNRFQRKDKLFAHLFIYTHKHTYEYGIMFVKEMRMLKKGKEVKGTTTKKSKWCWNRFDY